MYIQTTHIDVQTQRNWESIERKILNKMYRDWYAIIN